MRSDQVIMLTALGVILKDASYGVPQLNGSKVVVSANMSPLALLKGLPEEELPDKVIALGTKEALEKSGVVLIKEAKLPVELVQIPEGKSEEDLWEILRIMLSQVPRSSSLILELTHGFRSLPFIFFTGAFFLSSLYDVKIEHVFYGMFEAKENDVAPIVDLNIIIKMMEWFYASRVFRDTGRARYIVDLFKEKEFSEKDIRALESFSESYEAALPIELGKAAFEFRKRIGSLKQEEEFPVGPYIKEVLEEAVRPFEFRDKVKMKGKLKRNLSLTWDELMRQANIIDLYIERRQFNQAFGIMRELLVTIFLYHNPQFCEELWSTRRGRKKAEEYLGLWKYKDPSSGPGRLWDQVTHRRNSVSHSGFSGEDLMSIDWNASIGLWEEVKDSMDKENFWKVEVQDTSSSLPCLITPLGLSPGLLYTAIKRVKPGNLIVVTSNLAKVKIPEVLAKAEYSHACHVIPMDDVHLGFNETYGIADSIEALLDGMQEIVVNITGGTTALQYVLQNTSTKLETRCSVTRVAMVDRRSPGEIKDQPYVIGDMIIL